MLFIYRNKISNMNYITSLQAAEKWNISQRRVAILCEQNRISGAFKAGKTWLIPSDCEKPKDRRIKELTSHSKKRLFGSAPNLDFPDNIADLVPEKVEL